MGKKNELEDKKLTLEEYMDEYGSKPYNAKAAKNFLFMATATVGLVIFAVLFFVNLDVYKMNTYAGIAVTVLSVIAYIFLFIVPVVKINGQKAFITNVSPSNAREAKRYNKALREDIADKMIDFTEKTEGCGWYGLTNVGKLAIARQTHNDKMLKDTLSTIYSTDVRSVSNKMIRDHAVKIGVTTALSQSDKLDTIFVMLYELDLIKQLVMLYGYRPSDGKLLKIYRTVLTNALIAYGIQSTTANIAAGVTKKIGDIAGSIPVLGAAIGTVIDATSQGVINSSLTVVIGIQTKKYLKEEYHLQDMLDNVEFEDETSEEAEREMINNVKSEVSNAKANKKPDLATAK